MESHSAAQSESHAANMTLVPEIGWRRCIFCWRLPQDSPQKFIIVHVGSARTIVAMVRNHGCGAQIARILAAEGPTTSDYLRGALCGLSAVCIWAAFIIVSRVGVSTSLTPWDVAAIRFAVAGVILL